MSDPSKNVPAVPQTADVSVPAERKQPLALMALNPELRVKYDEFLRKINEPPDKAWVKEHPFIKIEVEERGQKKKVPLKYVPIERVESELHSIFQFVNVTVIEWKLIANSIGVQIRLQVKEPISDEWITVDGLAAVALQLNSGAKPTDFTEIKANAVMLALPAAKSYALKDAAELLGKRFGSDLNRKDEIAFQAAYAEAEYAAHEDVTNMATIDMLLEHKLLSPTLKNRVETNRGMIVKDVKLQLRTIKVLEEDIQIGEKKLNDQINNSE